MTSVNGSCYPVYIDYYSTLSFKIKITIILYKNRLTIIFYIVLFVSAFLSPS